MNVLKKLLYVLSWIPVFLLLTFPHVMVLPLIDLTWWQVLLPTGLIPLGFVVIPLALLFKANMKSFPIWGNREEGCPDWWLRQAESGEEGKLAKMFPRWWWFAIRNTVNNMRFWFNDDKPFKTYGWTSESMEAADLLANKVRKASRWRVRGLLAGWRVVWLDDNSTYSEIWLGWKVGSKVPGLGFTMQYRRKRKIGT